MTTNLNDKIYISNHSSVVGSTIVLIMGLGHATWDNQTQSTHSHINIGCREDLTNTDVTSR